MRRWDGPMFQEADSAAPGSAPGGGNADSDAGEGGDHMIPKSRFDEVRGQLRESLDRMETVERQLVDTQTALATAAAAGTREPDAVRGPTDGKPDELPQAPEGYNQLQAASHYIRKGIDRYFPEAVEKHFGADIATVKNALSQMPTAARNAAESAYVDLCKKSEIDPDDQLVRSAFKSRYSEASDIDKAKPERIMADIKKLLPETSTAAGARTATVVTTGVTSPVSFEDIEVRDKQHATELAMKGTRVKPKGILDIFATSEKRRRATR